MRRHCPALPRARTSLTACLVATTAVVATTGAVAPLSADAAVPVEQTSMRAGQPASGPLGRFGIDADSEIQVADLVIPSVSAQSAARVAASLQAGQPASTALAAHLRRPVTQAFSLLGVVWDHAAAPPGLAVQVRTRNAAGSWSRWQHIDMDLDSDSGSSPTPSQVKDGTAPVWVGPASGVEVAAFSADGTAPSGLSVSMIDPGRTADVTASPRMLAEQNRRGRMPTLPRVVTRRQWGADESLSEHCDSPRYGTTFKAVIVHHTVGSNNYSRRESAALVRGVYAYHTQSQGWCDIGYNFLIDKYGTIFEGRDGGLRRPVRGAHAGDYNVDTTGVSMMGNFENAKPTKAMKNSLVALTAWRLGTAYHGSYGRPFVYDHRIARISGHRNVMPTACPGRFVYAWLPTLRARVNDRLARFHSRIEKAWSNAGGASSPVGAVSRGEQADNRGRHTTFQHGRMYSSRSGVRTLYPGPVLRKYVKSGETDSLLGYPTSRVMRLGDGPGRSARFQRGRIYYSPRAGSYALVRSPVLKKYIALNGPTGRLGFPRSRVIDTRFGAFSTFQHGTIKYVRSSHNVIVKFQ